MVSGRPRHALCLRKRRGIFLKLSTQEERVRVSWFCKKIQPGACPITFSTQVNQNMTAARRFAMRSGSVARHGAVG